MLQTQWRYRPAERLFQKQGGGRIVFGVPHVPFTDHAGEPGQVAFELIAQRPLRGGEFGQGPAITFTRHFDLLEPFHVQVASMSSAETQLCLGNGQGKQYEAQPDGESQQE